MGPSTPCRSKSDDLEAAETVVMSELLFEPEVDWKSLPTDFLYIAPTQGSIRRHLLIAAAGRRWRVPTAGARADLHTGRTGPRCGRRPGRAGLDLLGGGRGTRSVGFTFTRS